MAVENTRGIAKGLAIGLALSWAARRLLPAMVPMLRPMAKEVTRAAMLGLERGREFTAELAEDFEDIVAEVQWELREGKELPEEFFGGSEPPEKGADG